MMSWILTVALAAGTINPQALLSTLFPSPELDAEIAKVRSFRDNATGPDRAIADRLLVELDKVRHPPTDASAMVGNIVAICRDVLALYPKDFEVQRLVVASFIGLPSTAENLGLDPVPLRNEAMALATKLTTDFPKESRAWEVYAYALTDEREIILALKKCHQMNPSEQVCSERHAIMLAGLARPQCLTKEVAPTFTAFAATEAAPGAAAAPRSTVFQGTTYALELPPVLTAADVAVISRNPAEERVIDLVLTAAGTEKLARESIRLSEHQGHMALMVGDTALTVARVVSPLPNGRLRLSTGTEPAEKMHYKLCKKVFTPKPPEELRL